MLILNNWLWHKKLNYLNFKTANLIKNSEVAGLPKIYFSKDKICSACQIENKVRSTFKNKGCIASAWCLELLHMDLFGPILAMSLGGMKYTLVIIDYYSRYIWIIFLKTNYQTSPHLINTLKHLQNEKSSTIYRIRNEQGMYFANISLKTYLDDFGIKHEFLAARWPQQNGVVERRNKTLKEASQTMLLISHQFWAKAVHTACYT